MKKAKYSIFHKPSKKDDIPLVLPKLNINNNKIAPTESIKFLSVLLDENLSWKTHIKYIENKISKNNENFPGHRFETQIHIQTRIRLNTVLTLATKHLMIINKNNLYLQFKAF